MSRFVLLDAGPLGLLANPNPTEEVIICVQWMEDLLANGVSIRVAEIADYEVRRELVRSDKTRSIRQLDELADRIGYLALNTQTMRLAAHFWARLRRTGKPTASNDALDGDVILAAQAAALLALGEDVIVATTNPRHLARLVPAAQWDTIAPSTRE